MTEKNLQKTSKNNIIDSIYYWLGKSRPFYINGEYKLELLHIDRIHNSAKIQITNLKTNEVFQQEVTGEQ